MKIKLFERVIELGSTFKVAEELEGIISSDYNEYLKEVESIIKEQLEAKGMDARFVSRELRNLKVSKYAKEYIENLKNNKEYQKELNVKVIRKNNTYIVVPKNHYILLNTIEKKEEDFYINFQEVKARR